MKEKRCKDCVARGVMTQREAKHPGPRCFTHHREFKRDQKARNHDKRVQAVYGLEPGDYEKLLEAQGGRCAIKGCRATGRSKRLAVDHHHASGEIRGLLCSVHNRSIGDNRDDPEAFRSLANYLENPPARTVLGHRVYTTPSDAV